MGGHTRRHGRSCARSWKAMHAAMANHHRLVHDDSCMAVLDRMRDRSWLVCDRISHGSSISHRLSRDVIHGFRCVMKCGLNRGRYHGVCCNPCYSVLDGLHSGRHTAVDHCVSRWSWCVQLAEPWFNFPWFNRWVFNGRCVREILCSIPWWKSRYLMVCHGAL